MNDVIDRLATKLSVPVVHLWAVLTRQGVLDGYSNLAYAAICLVIVVVVWCVSVLLIRSVNAAQTEWEKGREKGHRSQYSDPNAETTTLVMRVIRFALTVLLCVMAANLAIDGAKQIVNPEYTALHAIMGAIR